jgi:hypothetical protein
MGIAILRLERSMRDEGHAVLALDRLRRCRHRGIEVALVQDDLAVALQHLLVLLPEAFAAVVRIRASFPLDVERRAPLHRGPRRGCNDGHAARENDVGFAERGALDLEHVQHAVNLARPGVIERPYARIENGRTRNDGISHVGLDGVDTVTRLARHDVARVDRLAAGADDPVVVPILERRRVLRRRQCCRRNDELTVGDLGILRRAYDPARPRVALRRVHAEPVRGRTDELAARIRAHLAHQLPVVCQAGAAADPLAAAVLPLEAVRRLDDAERHLFDAHLVPLDVEFLGNHHRHRRAQALAYLRILASDHDAAIGIDLYEEAQHALAFLFVGQCRKTDDQATCGPGPSDQYLPAGDAVSFEKGAHDCSPLESSAAR